MPERVSPGPIKNDACIREAVCVHTQKIYDSCKDKDCIEDLRVYLTQNSKEAFENAASVRAREACLLFADVSVDALSYNKGCYAVDVRYFYKIVADAFPRCGRPTEIVGFTAFDKRVILYGSEGSAKTFSSADRGKCSHVSCERGNDPTAVVEALDPIILNLQIVEGRDMCGCFCDSMACLPEGLDCAFDSEVDFAECGRKLYVTLGQFSIIRLERDSQLIIPAYDYCMPNKECDGDTMGEEDPCSLFAQISFPVDEFFPPDSTQNSDCGFKSKKC
jgi:hypothetical protein